MDEIKPANNYFNYFSSIIERVQEFIAWDQNWIPYRNYRHFALD